MLKPIKFCITLLDVKMKYFPLKQNIEPKKNIALHLKRSLSYTNNIEILNYLKRHNISLILHNILSHMKLWTDCVSHISAILSLFKKTGHT